MSNRDNGCTVLAMLVASILTLLYYTWPGLGMLQLHVEKMDVPYVITSNITFDNIVQKYDCDFWTITAKYKDNTSSSFVQSGNSTCSVTSLINRELPHGGQLPSSMLRLEDMRQQLPVNSLQPAQATAMMAIGLHWAGLVWCLWAFFSAKLDSRAFYICTLVYQLMAMGSALIPIILASIYSYHYANLVNELLIFEKVYAEFLPTGPLTMVCTGVAVIDSMVVIAFLVPAISMERQESDRPVPHWQTDKEKNNAIHQQVAFQLGGEPQAYTPNAKDVGTSSLEPSPAPLPRIVVCPPPLAKRNTGIKIK